MGKPKSKPSRRAPGSGSTTERKGKLYARVSWTDAAGKRRFRERQADSRSHAERLIREMLAALESPAAEKPAEPTFREVAARFADKKLVAPEYAGDTRIRGMRSWQKQRRFLATLLAHFADRPLRSITYEDLADYRAARFTPTRRSAMRSVAMVNRELSLLRSVFNFARRSGLIEKSPFEMGDGLITLADEVRRDRLITFDEEARLLAVCTGRRAHLRAVVVAALDTGLRKGELLKLCWLDVSLPARTISVRSTTTKTRRARLVPVTSRLADELAALRGEAAESDLVFGGLKDVKRSFLTACRLAGIDDLHFHDLRHCATTRMIEAGMPPAQVMKITGHERWETFARYLNVNSETAARAAGLLDDLRAARLTQRSYSAAD